MASCADCSATGCERNGINKDEVNTNIQHHCYQTEIFLMRLTQLVVCSTCSLTCAYVLPWLQTLKEDLNWLYMFLTKIWPLSVRIIDPSVLSANRWEIHQLWWRQLKIKLPINLMVYQWLITNRPMSQPINQSADNQQHIPHTCTRFIWWIGW